jgi:L-iditol 2-dehydrogenase
MSLPARQRVVYLLGPERLEIREVDVPEPGPGELLVRVEAATTCGTDVKVFRRGGHPRMLAVPAPFGHEMAGTVVSTGPPAGAESAGHAGEGSAGPPWRARVGERVVVANSVPCGACKWCGRGQENLCADLRYLNGAFAEYLLVPRRFAEASVHRCPPELPLAVAALAEPLGCVLHGLESCPLDGPADIAVYGAGPIGLLFVNTLVTGGHRVVAADPNPGRLAVAASLGAAAGLQVGREGGEADRVRGHARAADGFDLAIEATGSPAAWWDALATVRPGGTVLLFGGCPPGTSVPLDTHHLHYSELTVKSAYHHRPATFRRALALLAGGTLEPAALLTAERPLGEIEQALRSMMRKEALKVVIRPHGSSPEPS